MSKHLVPKAFLALLLAIFALTVSLHCQKKKRLLHPQQLAALLRKPPPVQLLAV